MGLGNGSPQFEVTTRVNGKQIGQQWIHDPFIRTTVKLRGLRYAWNALTKGLSIQIAVDGTHGAVSAIMMLDPEKIDQTTAEFLAYQAMRRETNGIVGFCNEKAN